MARTLADLTPEERQSCVGMWAEWVQWEDQMELVVIEEVHPVRDYAGCVVPGVRYVEIPRHRLHSLIPRPDLMRAWNPDGTPVDMAEDVEYRIVDPDTNGGRYELRRWSRHVTEWTPQ